MQYEYQYTIDRQRRLRDHSMKQARFAKRNIASPKLNVLSVRYYVRLARHDNRVLVRAKRGVQS